MSRKFAYLLAAVAFGGGIVFERLGDSYLFAQEAKKPEWSHGLMLKETRMLDPVSETVVQEWGPK